MAALLGIDLGTSSVKVVVSSPEGRVLSTSRAQYPILTPAPGYSESDPERWWSALCRAVRDAVTDADGTPNAIGLSGQMHGVVLADGRGTPLRPAILWPDTRARAELATYERLDAAIRTRLANPLSPGMAGPMLAWVAAREPATLQRTRWALQPKDWLRMRLTGEARSEPTDASATLLYDVISDRWDQAVIDALGLRPDLFPEPIPSASIAGHLLPDPAEDLGLPVGTPVAAGAADTAAAMVGTGLRDPGLVQLTIGTGGQIVIPQAEPIADPTAGTHLYRTAGDEGWYAMAAILNAGLALDWVRDRLGAQWQELYASAKDPIEASDPLFLPHLVGERTPHLDARLRGAWIGLGVDHDRATLMRVALEGVAHALRDALDALPSGGQAPEIRLAGGGSLAPAWRQLLADVLGRALLTTDVSDASARGAALLAGIATERLTTTDVYGPLAPVVSLAAEPIDQRRALHAARLAWFRDEVQLRSASKP